MSDLAVAQQSFGLTFLAPTSFAELGRARQAEPQQRPVRVSWATTPPSLPEPCVRRGLYQATADAFLLDVPSVARYHVTKDAITITPHEGVSEEMVRLFLFGSAIGALLHLNGILALHASAVRLPDGGAAAFAGVSTAGKSTLAAALVRRGYRPIADDIVAVRFDEAGKGWVYPGLSRTKLWSDALSMLNLSKASGQQVRAGLDKYSVAVDLWPHPEPLEYLYEILPEEQCELSLTQVKGMERLSTLDRQTFRPGFIDALGLKAEHLQRLARLVPQVQVRKICRPRREATLDLIIGLLQADWA